MSPAAISLPERYHVVRHIANGGMASVWEAQDNVLGRSVAVKLLAEHLTADAAAARRFEREARAAAGLSGHPNVVTIYDFGEHDGRSFLVMELMRGGSIADLLRDGVRLKRENVVRWLGEAADALDAAHDAGVVHRDVKPGNMLLDERGRLGLADFGIARLATEDQQFTATGTILGTASYVSPEQAMGERAGPPSDRYALGIVAFELLTRTKPFQAEHYAAQARAHIEDPPPRASERDPELPPAVDGVLDRMLAKNPAERYPSSRAFVDALAGALEGRAAAAAVAPPTDVTRPMQVADRAPRAPERPARSAERPARVPPRRRPLSELGAPPAPEPRRGRWLPALLAALLGLVALGAIVIASGGGGGDDGDQAAQTRTEPREAERTPEATKEPTAEPTAEATAEPTAEATPTPTPTPTPTAEAGSGGSGSGSGGAPDEGAARRLNDDGFSRLRAGDAAGAVGPLQQAYQACQGSTAVDPCAYTLFNYARALRLSGNPAQAVPILEERKRRFPADQPGEVNAELARARAAAGKDG